MYLLHEGLDRQARVYFRFLQAQEAARPEEMAKLRRQALATLAVYVSEVEDLRDREGFAWAPFDAQFYADARAYSSQHPSPKTE